MYWLPQLYIKLTGFLPYAVIARPKLYYEDKSVQTNKIKGKAIIMSNHHSVTADYASVMFTFWRRTLRCLMGEVLFQKNAFFTVFLKILGGIKIDRYNPDYSFIPKCNKVLEKGGIIEIYPEGRVPLEEEKDLLEFKPGVVYLALNNDAPIIPIYNEGNYFGKGRNHIIIGKPIKVEELYDDSLDEKDNMTHIANLLREKVIYLKDELERQRKTEQERKKKKRQ